jgi:hypothetical protein
VTIASADGTADAMASIAAVVWRFTTAGATGKAFSEIPRRLCGDWPLEGKTSRR